MQLTAPGRPYKIKALEDADMAMLAVFCDKCKSVGWENNKDFTSMKIDKMVLPHGRFFIAIADHKIISVAGVHILPEVGPNAWRCLFRGAQLPGYTPKWSTDLFKSSILFGQCLYEQINLVHSIDSNAEFYLSTNVNADTGAKSSRMNDVMMPRIANRGIWSLHLQDFELYNVRQNIWKVNVDEYLRQRKLYL